MTPNTTETGGRSAHGPRGEWHGVRQERGHLGPGEEGPAPTSQETWTRCLLYTRPLLGYFRGKPTLMKHGDITKGGTIHKEIVIIKAESGKCTSLSL